MAHGIERGDSASAHVEWQGREVNRTIEPSFAFDSFARPPVIPGTCGQIDAARPGAFFDDRRYEQVAAPEIFIAEFHRFRVTGKMQPQRAHHGQPGVARLARERVIVGQQTVTQFEVLSADRLDLGIV